LISSRRIKCVDARDTETASQVTARKVKQVRGNQFQLFTILNPVPINPRDRPGFAKSKITDRAVNRTTVFVKRAIRVARPSAFHSATTHPGWRHRSRNGGKTRITGVFSKHTFSKIRRKRDFE